MRDYGPIDALSEILVDIPDLVFTYASDGRYLFINASAARFLGADPMDVIGRHWRDLGYPDDVMDPLQSQVQDVARTGESRYYRLTTSEARGARTLDLSLTPLRSDDGTVFAVLAIAHDISEFFSD